MDNLPARNASPAIAGGPKDPIYHVPFTPKPVTPEPPPPPMPAPIAISETKKYSEKNDPPLVDIKVTNPITYLKLFLKRLLKNEGIDIRLKIRPFTVFALILGLSISFGTGFNVARIFFPTSSPLLHRQITLQGNIQKSENNTYYLSLPDNTSWVLKTKTNSKINLGPSLVKGNLTSENYVIEASEIIPLASEPAALEQVIVPPPIPVADSAIKLYPNLVWEVTQSKTLLFTSGKRRIEQEGVYLESALVPDFPQAFIDYYTQNLQGLGFKETLNSSEPAGSTITYAKDDLFLTYGVKNIYSGSGENKKLTGYKAFIEHN